MKSALIVRPVDNNGRIVLPKHLLRDVFKAKDNEKLTLEFFYNDDSIILKRFHSKCVFCENEDDLVEFKGTNICPTCLENIKNIWKNHSQRWVVNFFNTLITNY